MQNVCWDIPAIFHHIRTASSQVHTGRVYIRMSGRSGRESRRYRQGRRWCGRCITIEWGNRESSVQWKNKRRLRSCWRVKWLTGWKHEAVQLMLNNTIQYRWDVWITHPSTNHAGRWSTTSFKINALLIKLNELDWFWHEHHSYIANSSAFNIFFLANNRSSYSVVSCLIK